MRCTAHASRPKNYLLTTVRAAYCGTRNSYSTDRVLIVKSKAGKWSQ
jgi:hypothetical protein